MPFVTKINFADNRQHKLPEREFHQLTGQTEFGLVFSALTSGPDLDTSGATGSILAVSHTFSGNNTEVNVTFGDSRMNIAESGISAITSSNSGVTQDQPITWEGINPLVIDGNTVYQSYTGVSFDFDVTSIEEIETNIYTGTAQSSDVTLYSADTLDFTGRTIWVDVNGITRTEDLIITDGAQNNYVWTAVGSGGEGAWKPASFNDIYTTGATLDIIDDTLHFDRTDGLSAYSVNLASINRFRNVGIAYSTNTFIDNSDGTITLPPNDVILYDNKFFTGITTVYSVTGGTTGTEFPELTDGDINYIYVGYNGGDPQYMISTDEPNYLRGDYAKYLTIYRNNNSLHILNWDYEGSGLANKLIGRLYETRPIVRGGGLLLTLSAGTNVVEVSSGVTWNGIHRQKLVEFDSVNDVFSTIYHSGGTFTYHTTATTVNNFYYDNGTDLVELTNNRYVVNWFYRGSEDKSHVYQVIGRAQYNSISSARLESVPPLPDLVSSHALLLGRIIMFKNDTGGVVESAFNTSFAATQVSLHNDLSGLQGGTSGQYYHLTLNQYNNVAYENVSNTFTEDQTINGGLSATSVTATTFNFSANTSGTCLTNLYVSNVYGCSPITVHSSLQNNTSTANGTYANVLGTSNVSNANNTLVFGGSGHTINSGATNSSILAGVDLTADTSNAAYFQNGVTDIITGYTFSGNVINMNDGVNSPLRISHDDQFGGTEYLLLDSTVRLHRTSSNYLTLTNGVGTFRSSNEAKLQVGNSLLQLDSDIGFYFLPDGTTNGNMFILQGQRYAGVVDSADFLNGAVQGEINCGIPRTGVFNTGEFGSGAGSATTGITGDEYLPIFLSSPRSLAKDNSSYDSIRNVAFLGGSDNTVLTAVTNSTIIGGSGHTITSGITNSAIIGGTGITGDSSDTVYVPDLIIDGLTSTDPIATDADGRIVAGTSDKRLKRDIQPLTGALDKVLKLDGVSFEYTEDSNMGGGKRFGFIAQDVETVIPEMVRKRAKGDGMLTLNYDEVIPWLVQAFKELVSGDTKITNSVFKTQTIAAEDNVIELNYNGNHQTAIDGGILIKKALPNGGDAFMKIDEFGRWILSPAVATAELTLPKYTPSSSHDSMGGEGNVVWDEDYLYIKTEHGWKRTKLETF